MTTPATAKIAREIAGQCSPSGLGPSCREIEPVEYWEWCSRCQLAARIEAALDAVAARVTVTVTKGT